MQAPLQALLLCSDEKVIRVLRRVLGELEIQLEQFAEVDGAVQKLTRQRFEAIIVDCTSEQSSSSILTGVRTAPANKRALTVAIVDYQSGQWASQLGAHFVLFKPLTLERTRSSFRSVRALMKRERRRHARIPVELQVEFNAENGSAIEQTVTTDVGENGIAVKRPGRKLPASFVVRLNLPGADPAIESAAEVAWESKQNLGIRFRDLPLQGRERLKGWINRQLAGLDSGDPPVTCKLTDLSLGACYLQTESPFPVRTCLNLTMKLRNWELQIEGIVRVMHSGAGMGVEFTQHTDEQRTRVQRFIQALVNSEGSLPDLQVRPEGIDATAQPSRDAAQFDSEDPLLFLFRRRTDLAAEDFHAELRKQRGVHEEPVLAT